MSLDDEQIAISTVVDPFEISFHWENRSAKVTLKRGEDVFQLMRIYTSALENAGIEYIEESEVRPNGIS